ncbi:hypothetical protein V8F20_005345 [Naviculisporaceae sp. PSN 640]
MPSVKSLLLTALAGAVAVSAAPTVAAAAQNFEGKGQIRATYYQDTYEDLGCLTDQGLWTTNESLCGTFTGVTVGDYRQYTLTTAAGACYVDHISLKCGNKPADNNNTVFGIYPVAQQIGGGEAFRYGQYGLMGGVGGVYPPGPNDPPIAVKFWSSVDIDKKMVWLTWKAL